MKRSTKLFNVLCAFFCAQLFSQNLLTNGDFESGGSGNGFTVPNYNLYGSTTGNMYPGSYAISSNPSALNQYFISPIEDHSPGTGNNMMVVDGHTNSNASFWSAGNDANGLCGLIIGQTYTFSYWVRTISSTTVDNTTQPNIVANFTNATGTLNYGNPTVDLPTVGWQQVIYSFVPTATCVNINLININTSPGGNDFALDDLEVVLQLCPLTILSINNPDAVCEPNTVDITDPTVTAGSVGNGVLTYWEDLAGTVPLSLPPNAINISGTYYIKSVSGPTCSDIKPVLVTIKPTITPFFTTVPPICEGETLASLPLLSNNGVIGTWSPALDNTTTTTYTFTPDASLNPNLVINGDFSDGNTGFSTDYANIPTSDGLQQGVYGITTNSNLWFNSLSSCSDHTGGGNFMVADGSISNGGNDSVWCQTIPVLAGENFIFSFAALSVSSGSPANFEVTINGVAIGTTTLDFSTCNWIQSSFPWTSGSATTANICIYNRNTTSFGNDFGIDDISFVPLSIQCAAPTTMTIEVTPLLPPSFDPVAPICSGDVLSPLPTTSLEGITGVWSPALDNTTTTTYTFTPDAGQCSIPIDLAIVVNPSNVTPTFDPFAPICLGDALSSLPTTSLEGISGVWSPALDNTITTTYTFTPDAGQCAVTQTLQIIVNNPVLPTFDAVAPICSGDVLAPLPLTSLEGITGVWSPALDNTATKTYTFTPDVGQCATTQFLQIHVNPIVTPTFDPVASICSGDVLSPLSTTSLEGITGVWSPALDNTVTTTYTFTPDAGQCASTATMQIDVNDPVTPTFDPVAPICSGDALSPLPTTSLEGITGVWSPALDNTATTIYTFVPDIGECAITQTMQIIVNDPIIPTFNPIAPICSGDVLSPLPTTSLEGITGVWSPALDNTATTTYTFTPSTGECATAISITIQVNLPDIPTFDPIAPICSGDVLAPLPLTSLEGIIGVWSPALDNTVTTTYTFTPDFGQCAGEISIDIVVNQPLVPQFDLLVPICEGELAPVLPVSSLNGITGTWSSAVVDNMVSGDYTFTPDPGQCATNQVIHMTINQPTLTNVVCEVGEPFSGNRTITVYASASGIYEYQLDGGVPQYENVFNDVTPGNHTVTVSDINGCSASITTEVLVIDYPKFFTPNGDGINDTWNLFGLNQPDSKVYIFDRYGKLLKQISSVSSGWDGTFNGEELPSTDYWFTVDFLHSNTNKQFKAHFSLKR